PSANEYTRGWGLTNDRYKTIENTSTIIMHPGPMNRGLEISAAAADSAQNTALEQVANGVSVRMAVLYLLLAGQLGQ
ncbi:MAG TPA: aspartate carbamoyltransferase, partial [Enteractinococcus sp.]